MAQTRRVREGVKRKCNSGREGNRGSPVRKCEMETGLYDFEGGPTRTHLSHTRGGISVVSMPTKNRVRKGSCHSWQGGYRTFHLKPWLLAKKRMGRGERGEISPQNNGGVVFSLFEKRLGGRGMGIL